MKKILFVAMLCVIAMFSCTSDKNSKPDIKYLNSQQTIYTKGDTLELNGRKYIKVYGVTNCKYACPVLIEAK